MSILECLQNARKNQLPYNQITDTLFKALIDDCKKNQKDPDLTPQYYDEWNMTSFTTSITLLIYFSLYERDHPCFDFLKRNLMGYVNWGGPPKRFLANGSLDGVITFLGAI